MSNNTIVSFGLDCHVDINNVTEDSSVGSDWYIGLILALVGNFSSVMGLSAQRWSQVKNQEKPEEERRKAGRQPINMLGIVLMAVGAILDSIAFGFAPQSFLAPLGAVTLVMNVISAPCILKEKLTKLDLVATVLVFGGVLIAILFASRESPVYSFDDLICLFIRRAFEIFAIALVLWLIFLGALIYSFGPPTRYIPTPDEAPVSVGPPLSESDSRGGGGGGGVRPLSVQEADDVAHAFVGPASMRYKILRLAYPTLGGTFGGGSVLFGKSVIELVKSTIQLGSNEFKYVGTYVMLGLTFVCLFLQVRFLNLSLKHFQALFVVPVYQAWWVLANILAGSVYFDELRTYTETQWIMYPSGLAVMFVGIALLSQRKPPPPVTPGPSARLNSVGRVDSTKSLGPVPVSSQGGGSRERGRSINGGHGSVTVSPGGLVGALATADSRGDASLGDDAGATDTTPLMGGGARDYGGAR